MKRLFILAVIFFVACSTDWDSGSSSSNAYQEQRQEEQQDFTRNQMPAPVPEAYRNEVR